ncbi:patatin-like phospholipase domain-containing protein 2 [Lampris incognitus]|uniref:patatin-like phospholipase domain-containing protein 2 n=1 Tax=Lampris incognitus TaxID=2546036 RepID=UPI0024B5867B|nr:patatin-like phospholipase domain-containing protein 2 [Lampris incognitus]
MAPRVSSHPFPQVPPSVSFSGSGFMATYQLGAAQCLLNNVPWMLHTAPFVLGASAGSLVAASVVCEVNLVHIRDEILRFISKMTTFTLGPLNPSINVFHWLEFVLRKHLPANAHLLANGRLAVAMTSLPDGKNKVMSEFRSKEDVIQALLCSCFVPGYCGVVPPSFKGVHYFDGGFTSMTPVLPATSSRTLTVSPFSGEMDICPRDTPSICDMIVSGSQLKVNVANSLRIVNALYPLASETLEQAYHSGYKDAIYFLQTSDHIPYLRDKVTLETHSCCQMKKWINPEASYEEKDEKVWRAEQREEDQGKEDTGLTSRKDAKHLTSSDSCENTLPTTEPNLLFELIQRALLCNLVGYISMFAFPLSVLSYLVLPFTLPVCFILQDTHSMRDELSQASVLLRWLWLSLRQINLFMMSVFICSVLNMRSRRGVPLGSPQRVNSMVILTRRLNIEADYEVPNRKQQG